MTPPQEEAAHEPIRVRTIVRTWLPLALSWMMMGLEMPALSAIVARLAYPEINLAAFGGVVFPIALIIEAPIIMMLAASTALSRDLESFRRLRRFMYQMGFALTAVHALVAFSPLFDFFAVRIIGAPSEVIEPARLGLQLMTFWTWAIADRRFHQGVLIRFGRTRAIGVGTVIRLVATCTSLVVGYLLGDLPGIAVATISLTVGVFVEAFYVRFVVSPVVHGPLREARDGSAPRTFNTMLAFYVPLAMTPLLQLLAQPMGSAAISRLPEALACLAAWPALGGLIFLTRSVGIAYNEIVVAYAGRDGAMAALRRFNLILSAGTSATLLLLALTPLGRVWFSAICGLDEHLTSLAAGVLWIGLLLPMTAVWQSYFQGLLVHRQKTRGIPESVVVFLVGAVVVFLGGVAVQKFNGLAVTLLAFTVGGVAQTAWLAYRCVEKDSTARLLDYATAGPAPVKATRSPSPPTD